MLILLSSNETFSVTRDKQEVPTKITRSAGEDIPCVMFDPLCLTSNLL